MRQTCKCCGTPYRVAFAALDEAQNQEMENMIEIWGEATIMRVFFPGGPSMFGINSKGWDDPIWDREWAYIRAGRGDYPNDTPGHLRAGAPGKKQLIKLTTLVADGIAQEVGLYAAGEKSP